MLCLRRHLVFAVVVTMLVASLAQACPMCKDSIPNSDASQAAALPTGFNYSVYFILCSFLAVLGSLVMFLVKSIRDTGTRPAFEVVPPSTATSAEASRSEPDQSS